MGKVRLQGFGWHSDGTRGMSKGGKASHTPAFCLVRIDWKGVVIAPPWMGHMIGAAANGAAIPGVDQIEYQWRVHWNGGMETRRRLPGPIAHSGHKLMDSTGWP